MIKMDRPHCKKVEFVKHDKLPIFELVLRFASLEEKEKWNKCWIIEENIFSDPPRTVLKSMHENWQGALSAWDQKIKYELKQGHFLKGKEHRQYPKG